MLANEEKQSSLINSSTDLTNRNRWGIYLHFSERRLLLVVVDLLIVSGTAYGSAALWNQRNGLLAGATFTEYWYVLLALIGGWWLLAWLNDLYDVHSSANVTLTAMRLAVVGVSSLIILAVARLLVLDASQSLLFAYFLGLALPSLALWRWAYALAFNRPPFYHRLLIVGAGKRGRVIADGLRQGPGLKYRVVGYVDDNSSRQGEVASEGLLRLGQESELPELTRRFNVDEIVVAMEEELTAPLFQLLVECQAQGVRVSWMPDLYGKLYRQVPIEHIDPAWALHALQGRYIFNLTQRASKRLLDLVLVVSALPFLLVLFVPLAVAIRLDSEGPVFYRQLRSGRGNKPFSIFKFRTMRVDAEKDGQARWATRNDPRVTRVGRFLRKSRLDELPQVINVLRGEMSVVGPRPERPEFITELQQQIPFFHTRLVVKPGITGWAQIHYDYGNSTEDASVKLQYDFYYIRYWSLWLDLYILYRTVAVVARLKGM